MSWHCSQALAAVCSEVDCLAGEQSAQLKSTTTAGESSCSDSATEFSTHFQSGTTCGLSTGDRGVDSWISSLAASRARTFQQPAKAPESTASEAGCGPSSRGSLAKYDRSSRSWKTRQCSLLGGLVEFSETFPKWGSMRGGALYQHKTPSGLAALRRSITSAEESGSSQKMPTPTANIGERGGRGDLLGTIRGYQYTRRRHRSQAEKVPTPHGFSKDGKSNGPSGNELGRAVNQSLRVATPTARDWRSGKASVETLEKNSRPLSEQIGGSLNPPWVEWLMGWPIEWTALQPLATDKFQQWLEQHGTF